MSGYTSSRWEVLVIRLTVGLADNLGYSSRQAEVHAMISEITVLVFPLVLPSGTHWALCCCRSWHPRWLVHSQCWFSWLYPEAGAIQLARDRAWSWCDPGPSGSGPWVAAVMSWGLWTQWHPEENVEPGALPGSSWGDCALHHEDAHSRYPSQPQVCAFPVG
jgi:hypothetical protein